MVLLCNALIHYYLTIAHFFQVTPSSHYMIYLGTFSATFIRNVVFIFLLKISIDNRPIHRFPKIHNHSFFLISCSSTVPPHYFLIPYFPSPTCPLRSAPKTILSCFDTLSINPSKSLQKLFFSSTLLLNCGAYALTLFRMDAFTFNFMAISLSDTLFICRTLSTSSSLTTIG